MTQQRWLIAGIAGLLPALALADAGQDAQPIQPAAAIEVKDLPRLFDPKKLDDPKTAAEAAAHLEKAFQGRRQPEAVRMLIAILNGSHMGGETGWFGPADSRFTWKWLAKRSGTSADKGIPRAKFAGPDAWFAALDRNKDGAITANDLDWSDHNPEVQMMYFANRVFRKLNAGGNGKLTKNEIVKFYEQAAQGKDFLSPEDFHDAIMGGQAQGFLPGDAPTREMMIRGLYEGSLGSMQEGPPLEGRAPNFTLKTVDGKQTIELHKMIGHKPVVLVLGNFTCGPFRSLYASIETLHQKYKNDANFVMVYVREAHPSDGWKMESNTRVGVIAKQPTNLEERRGVAGQFCERLKPTMPVAVDEIDDPVGTAYSGMPGRLYVIDVQGKVAYKSGRGPFGFRFGEMEQAVVMALLEHQTAGKR